MMTMVAGAALLLSGCGTALERGYMPEPITEDGPAIITLWNGAWIAALAVGVLVWGLILWCMVAYRRRHEDQALPPQIRYNVPIEILYTIVPVLMVAVLFGKTVEVQNEVLSSDQEPDVTVNVIGKKWSWDANYIEDNVYIEGVQASGLSDGEEGLFETLPTIVLPVDSRVEFVLTSRDVIHSFWVPGFMKKLDMIPGRVNSFQVVTTEEGTFTGKCAELCGAYHSQMLFRVQVVPQGEYDQFVTDLEAAGSSGQLSNDLNLYPLYDDPQRKSFYPDEDEGVYVPGDDERVSQGSN
ncbi:aa3-type cytochrome oxidase subunit II [Ornithinimicrobium sediminis]|uniref:aa3-type cytochrome oxidase subunit II n=1 Tax=Ornithinimicrobium sediminis TaxID=2904603 RepID=UPI001E3F7759|nr:cytochrome c oxidase subunit II [Ornithinimicrobium sediminis]MCE0488039.1 cytochrome c oxidase subunit II [Ornithinimicrobium sediminis]